MVIPTCRALRERVTKVSLAETKRSGVCELHGREGHCERMKEEKQEGCKCIWYWTLLRVDRA